MSSLGIVEDFIIVSQEYTIWVSFIILFAGILGDSANILLLTRLKIFRNNPSAFYIIAESIANLFQMFVPFTSRIAMNGFADDLTQTSLFWCKFRPVLAQAAALISLNSVCFASIDQSLSTSHRPYIRQMSTIFLAKILVLSLTTISILHGIPTAIFYEIHSISGCYIYNQSFRTYITYVYYLFLIYSLPIFVSSLFSIIAYRNVRHIIRRQMPIRRRKLDRQLTAMILARVAFLVVTITPYVLQRIYTLSILSSENNVIQQAILQLVDAVTISLLYINYAGSFYIFLLSSARFRRQVRYVLINKCWGVLCRKRNQ